MMTPCSKMRCARLLPPHPGAARCHRLPWGEGECPAAECRIERAGQFAGAWEFRALLPLTPALSLGEREDRSARFRQSRASRVVAARVAVFALPEGEGEDEARAPPLPLWLILRT